MNIHEKELTIALNLEVDNQTVTVHKKIPYEVLADALICNISSEELTAFFQYVAELSGDLALCKELCASFAELDNKLREYYGKIYDEI